VPCYMLPNPGYQQLAVHTRGDLPMLRAAATHIGGACPEERRGCYLDYLIDKGGAEGRSVLSERLVDLLSKGGPQITRRRARLLMWRPALFWLDIR
jgi:hypothetical protein